jgi:hypothetical protein
MGMWRLIGSLSPMVLVMVYISEKWFRSTWQGFTQASSLREVLREWILYMLLFSSLTVLLEIVLDSACWTVCFQAIETVKTS